jgi:serine/threonine protein kinase
MLSAGQTLAHFELIEEIGAGGMGVVFKARDTRLGRLVAIKVLSPAREGAQDSRARLRRDSSSPTRQPHARAADRPAQSVRRAG